MASGRAEFLKWIIIVEGKPDEKVFCYSEKDFNCRKAILDKRKKTYRVEKVEVDKELEEKVKGIRFRSKSEILAFLNEGIEPESMIIPNLKKRIEALERRV